MSKYKTKQIDYTGCMWCRVWDSDRANQCTLYIGHDIAGQYIEAISEQAKKYNHIDDYGWDNAEPISTTKRIMPPERAIPVLIAEGWKFDAEGCFTNGRSRLWPSNFHWFGKELPASPCIFTDDMGCIIEDVDE